MGDAEVEMNLVNNVLAAVHGTREALTVHLVMIEGLQNRDVPELGGCTHFRETQLALVSLEQRLDILTDPNDRIVPNGLLGLSL
jgi:hypothetical protein